MQTVTNSNFYIFTVSESWHHPPVCDAGYSYSYSFRQDRGSHRRGGGVHVYVKNIFKACVIEKWFSVSETNFSATMGESTVYEIQIFPSRTVYRPPDAPIDFLENLSKTLSHSLLHGLNVMILGDLNHLCPEMHAMAKMAKLAKNRQPLAI